MAVAKTKPTIFLQMHRVNAWSPELAVKELKRFRSFFHTTSAELVQKRYRKLYAAFARHKHERGWFKTWDDLVAAADLEAKKNLAHVFWTKGVYLGALKAYFTSHPTAPVKQFEFEHSDAYTAFKRHYSDWGLPSTTAECLQLVDVKRQPSV